LFDGDEATIRTAAATVDSTPFIRISRGCTDREQHWCGSRNNRSQYADAARPRRLLHAQNKRQGGRRAVKKGDERSPSHPRPNSKPRHCIDENSCRKGYVRIAADCYAGKDRFGFKADKVFQWKNVRACLTSFRNGVLTALI